MLSTLAFSHQRGRTEPPGTGQRWDVPPAAAPEGTTLLLLLLLRVAEGQGHDGGDARRPGEEQEVDLGGAAAVVSPAEDALAVADHDRGNYRQVAQEGGGGGAGRGRALRDTGGVGVGVGEALICWNTIEMSNLF